ncbi:MAG TPA: archaemetzincin family Zn-dependent metalloprotease [Sulfuricaulis sp.]|nr:archaemetzincin family Zn-dependent metalloprotease [Sulfuricaulis sp.]
MALITVVTFGMVNTRIESEVAGFLAHVLGCEIRRGDPLSEPAAACDERRGQWMAVEFLKVLLPVAPRPGRILGLTVRDLYIPMLSFLFGQAQLDGAAAVVSVARLRQEFYGLPGNEGLLLTRARKEALHELGHTFGLVHCADPLCAMSLSTSLPQVDTKRDEYCESCGSLARARLAALNGETT